MWFIGVEEQKETSAPPLKKILDPPLELIGRSRECMKPIYLDLRHDFRLSAAIYFLE